MIKIRQLRKQHNLTMKQFGEIFGIAESTVSLYENGKRQADYDTLKKIADYFNVSVDYLLGREAQKSKKGVLIPVLGRVVAGIPIDAIEEILDYEEITQEMANSGEFFALKIKGDSMMPRIQENDVVIVRKQSQVDNGSIAIVLINGNEATCKKVQYNEKGVALISYNSSYTPMFYTKEECLTLPVTIIGKVVELRAKF